MKTINDEDTMIAELRQAFPRTDPRSLRQWSNRPSTIGAVVCGEAQIDGLDIGPYINPGCDPEPNPYNGWVLQAFEEWCAARGWYVEVYEPGTLWVVPLPDVDDAIAALPAGAGNFLSPQSQRTTQ